MGELEPEVTPPQRRADALGLVAEQALARGFGGIQSEVRDTPGYEDRAYDWERDDLLLDRFGISFEGAWGRIGEGGHGMNV